MRPCKHPRSSGHILGWASLIVVSLIAVSPSNILAGTYSGGVFEERYFGGQVTLRLEFQPSEAVPFDFREVVETYRGYQYPYTYFLIPSEYRSSILSYSVSGGARVTLTRSNDQFDWSSRRLITANPFRMETNRYYRFQIDKDGQPDVYAYFALEKSDPPVTNVEMEVSGAPWLDAGDKNRVLILADERFPAVFKIQLLDADKWPKEPLGDPQSVIVTVADRDKGRIESSAGNGRQVTLTTDSNGEAEFHYVYSGLVPTDQPMEETITIGCPALNLVQTASVSVGLKPKILGVVDRWDGRTHLPRTMGLRIQIEDEFWPQLDYLEYNRVLANHHPQGSFLGMYVTTEWLNPPKQGWWKALMTGVGFTQMLRPGEDQFFNGRGRMWKFQNDLFEAGGRQLVEAIDSPAIQLELHFPAHVFVREGPRWLTAQVGLIVYPENVEDPVEEILGTKSNTMVYAVDVLAGGESVLKSVACSFQPTSAAQYWMKTAIYSDFFKEALVIGGGAPVIVTLKTVELFDLACDFLKGDYFSIMQATLADYVDNLEALVEAEKIDLTPDQLRWLARGIAVNEGKEYYDHLQNVVESKAETGAVPAGRLQWRSPAISLPDVPDDVNPEDLRPILNASVAGLLAALDEPQLELVIISGGAVLLQSPDASPYPEESIFYAVEEEEGSNVYLLERDSALFLVSHFGPLEITRFLPTVEGAVAVDLYSIDPGSAATTTLDCSGDSGISAQVDLGSNGSVDQNVAPQSDSYSGTPDDRDGVPTSVEDQGPNGGDANRDGVLDSLQPHVASLPNAVDARYVTLVSSEGTNFSGVQAFDGIPADPAPEGVSFPLGVFQFHVDGLRDDETMTVQMLLPEAVEINSYYQYGSTPAAPIDRWYAFPLDRHTGAEMEEHLVRLHYRDAQMGDDYPHPDGLVITAGAPARVSRTHQLNFAQFATGGGLFSEITLLNRDTEAWSDAEVDFWTDKGDPLNFRLQDRMVRGQLQLSIPPLGIRMLQTDGSGSPLAGSADVSSNRSLAGVLVFGGAFGLAGVGNSKESTTFLAPMEKISSGNINTGIAMMNPGGLPVTLTLQLYSADGEVLATASENLPAKGHKALFANQFGWSPPVALDDFLGVLEGNSSGPIAVTVLQTRPGQFATMPVAMRRAGSASSENLNIAHFATGGGLFSEMMLLNLDPLAEADVEIRFRDDSGGPLTFQLEGEMVIGQRRLSIPASGIRVLQTDGSGPPVAGSVEVDSDRPLAGVLVFGGEYGLAGVGSSEDMQSFLAPMQRVTARGINTGVAVMSLDDSQQTLDLRLLDRDGRLLASATETLAAGGHKAVFVNQFAWQPMVALSDFQGVLEVSTSGRIAVTVLQTRPGQFATMPVVVQ